MSYAGTSAESTPDEYPDSGPVSPGSVDESSGNTTPGDHASPLGDGSPFSNATHSPIASPRQSQPQRRGPSVRAASDPSDTVSSPANPNMTASSTVAGTLNNARRPPPSAGNLPLDLMAKARALQQQRMAMSPHMAQVGGANGSLSDSARSASPAGVNLRLPPHMNRNINLGGMARPTAPGFQSAPAVPSMAGRSGGPSLSERRAMKLGRLPGDGSPGGTPKLSDMGGGAGAAGPGRPPLKAGRHDSRMSDFKHYIDAEKGWITFEGAATITRTGVNFAGGHTFKISLDEIQVLDELGKGNYGTVYKVRHAKPVVPRFGQGLSGFKTAHHKASQQHAAAQTLQATQADGAAAGASATTCDNSSANNGTVVGGTTGKVMAMKEIRLELDEAKFATILKELVILHECVSPYIIDFYGAFFQEGAVYMCIEFMDGGSIDKLYAGGIPENVLQKITYSTVMGLKTLKVDHNIIHRDVKPTNILANSQGQVKICDFGVSGNLVASIAKTNIGCQSYMAPERISGGGMAQGANAEGTYSVQSDIWSLGLTIIECAMGRYPYPPEVSSTIFSQLSAIVNGEPPNMPEGYSPTACDFVRSCLNKNPMKRSTYSMLLSHPWLKPLAQAETVIEEEDESGESDSDSESDDEGAKAVNKLSLNGSGSETLLAGDAEVAVWVSGVLERKKNESREVSNAATKPALHAAPLAP
ncbi:MAP kinase kinase Wis1 [Sporothrix curviconia]|uniref:mitogen-activated protein kinase kinase n=1 Tax=Sporothrix curviconia TaxID=1260050 RepID=A0ABP0APU2_9PEZI